MATRQTIQALVVSVLLAVSFSANAAKNIVRVFDPEVEDWVVLSLAGEEAEQNQAERSSFSAYEKGTAESSASRDK